MSAFRNPAVQAFVAQLPNELLLAQVLIRRAAPGYELRHADDRDRPAKTLRELPLPDLRSLAQFTAGGAFRPLKSAPNLPAGWRLPVNDDVELERALNELYPGAVADWFAARMPGTPVTHYRDFTSRQTGMYRLAAMVSDPQAAQVIRACCHPAFCLKRRLWTVNGLPPDSVEEKSLIPCLEPCALLLELARKAMRIEQEEKVGLELSPGEAKSLAAALDTALARPDPGGREADFNEPGNPRRLRLLREKVRRLLPVTKISEEE